MDGEDSIPRSFSAILFRIFFPLTIFFVVSFGFVIRYMHLRYKSDKKRPDRGYLKSRMTIYALAVIFFAYQDLTEDFMRIINCVDLDEDIIENDVSEYRAFAIARSQ